MITKNRIKTVLTAMAFVAMAAGSAFAALAPGVTLDFDASNPASGISSTNWNPLIPSPLLAWNLVFGADVTLEDVSTLHKITKAYRFTGGTGDNSQEDFSPFNENDDASWEFWIKPSDTGTLDTSQTLFESGGSGDGIAFWYQPGTLGDNQGTVNFTIDNGANQSTVRAVIDTTDFCHITGVYNRDFDGSIDLMQIYVNGVLVDDNISATTTDDPSNDTNPTSIHDWTGTDNGGLGNGTGTIAQTASGGRYNGYIAVFRFWELKALTAAEVEDNFRVLGVTDPMRPNPEDGAEVAASSTRVLSWINLEPTTGSDVWVDVYFGTDGNSLPALTTDPADGLNVTSVTVDASVVGQAYYWRVDSYVNGSRTGDPNEGRLYVFYASDLAPSLVDAGIDMITWYGRAVQLDATVEDDGVSALGYLWTANPANGVVFSDETAKSPTVTIFTAPYSAAKIVNSGFEETVVADGAWGWASSWRWIGYGQGFTSGTWNPGAATGSVGYGGNAPEGNNVAWVGVDPGYPEAGLFQVLTETLAADTIYQLTVEVGNSPLYDWPGYKVQLLAGGIVLAEDIDSATVADNTFETSTVTFDSTGVALDLVGKPLEIRLLVIAAPGENWAELNFDSVQLTANPPFPYPPTTSVELTVAVTDEGNETPVEDTLTIDVYNDACAMAVALDPAAVEITDFDADCITNLKDFALLALKWLDDYSLTAPVSLP